MNFTYSKYRFLTTGLYFSLVPLFDAFTCIAGIKHRSMEQRLGRYHGDLYPMPAPGRPKIWVHTASVGEVIAGFQIVDFLYSRLPSLSIVFSTTTKHGNRLAREKLGARALCVYAPLDFPPSVQSALKFFRPDVLLCVETEIWPNWLIQARKMGIKTAMVNGRISKRSMERYKKIKPLIKSALQGMDLFSMIGQDDAMRIHSLGAEADRISVNGNAKYDAMIEKFIPQKKEMMAALMNLGKGEKVFVAGSTRTGEEEMALDAYEIILKLYPDTILMLAPRHVERSGEVVKLANSRGFDCQLRSDLAKPGIKREARVIVMDTIGELQFLYSLASIAFCGGSLVPLGGHNILEAAVWGNPVFYGPYMDDFLDAKEILEKAGAGLEVMDGKDLGEKALELLGNPQKNDAMGAAAIDAVLMNKGASQRHGAAVLKILSSIPNF